MHVQIFDFSKRNVHKNKCQTNWEFSSQEQFWLDMTSSFQVRIPNLLSEVGHLFLSLNELGVKLQGTTIIRKFVNKL